MNSKRFIRLSLCMTLALLIIVASIQIAIDPLFQYHKPWFGMEPFIKKERYQDAGMAKNFEFENVIMGTSMAQNFKVKEFERLFDGKTIKLTMEGSHPLDWTFLLNDLEHRPAQPKVVLMNLDPYVFRADTENLEHELPLFLYDYDYCNDVNYWFNFQIIREFTSEAVIRNIKHDLPDINETFVWTKYRQFGSDIVLSQYTRNEISSDSVYDDIYVNTAADNMKMITPYISSMSDTRFIVFCSPFSMLFWDGHVRDNSIEAHKRGYFAAISELLKCENVDVFLWNDSEMLKIMSDLDNYADEAHYSEEINSLMLERIANSQGMLTRENYKAEVDKLFDYIESFDYDSLFE